MNILRYLLAFLLLSNIMTACSQSNKLGSDYSFALFDGTSNRILAKAVENEDTNAIVNLVKAQGLDINLRDPLYGKTLLSLAVSNGKKSSVQTLLKLGANVNVRDTFSYAAIHRATEFIDLRQNVAPILELLLKYGANPNMIVDKGAKQIEILRYYLPLMGAIHDTACTKILLRHGADLYYKINDDYPVWKELFLVTGPENLAVLKYLLLDNHYKVPDPIFYKFPDHDPQSASELIGNWQVRNAEDKQTKEEITAYLKK